MKKQSQTDMTNLSQQLGRKDEQQQQQNKIKPPNDSVLFKDLRNKHISARFKVQKEP